MILEFTVLGQVIYKLKTPDGEGRWAYEPDTPVRELAADRYRSHDWPDPAVPLLPSTVVRKGVNKFRKFVLTPLLN